ncbi:MAG: hypothetical protein KDD64_11615 [Bdellovibrionales bacterium]|nr:hypothetical protein [Bdellovibrionales bacterium]
MGRIVFFVALLFVGFGCSSRKPVRFDIPVGERVEGKALEQLVSGVEARIRGVDSVRSLSRVRVQSSDASHSFRWAIVYESPERVRIETLPLNTFYSLQTLASSDGEFAVVVPSERTFFSGKVTRRRIGEFLGVPFEIDESMALLLGGIPVSLLSASFSSGDLVGVVRSDDLIELVDKSQRFRARVGSKDFIIHELDLRDPFDDQILLELQADSVIEIAGFSYPGHLKLTLPKSSQTTEVWMSIKSLNTPVEEQIFSLTPPAGFAVRELP